MTSCHPFPFLAEPGVKKNTSSAFAFLEFHFQTFPRRFDDLFAWLVVCLVGWLFVFWVVVVVGMGTKQLQVSPSCRSKEKGNQAGFKIHCDQCLVLSRYADFSGSII